MSYRSVKLSQGMLTQLVNKEKQTFIASSFIVISYSLFHFPISSLLYPISNIHNTNTLHSIFPTPYHYFFAFDNLYPVSYALFTTSEKIKKISTEIIKYIFAEV